MVSALTGKGFDLKAGANDCLASYTGLHSNAVATKTFYDAGIYDLDRDACNGSSELRLKNNAGVTDGNDLVHEVKVYQDANLLTQSSEANIQIASSAPYSDSVPPIDFTNSFNRGLVSTNAPPYVAAAKLKSTFQYVNRISYLITDKFFTVSLAMHDKN